MNNDAALLAALAITATCVGSLVWIIKYMFNTFKPIMDELVKVTQANTEVTKNADTYLQQRNGRDIEFHTAMMTKIEDIPIQAKKAAHILAAELKRVGDLTAQKVEQVKETASHPTDQAIQTQTVEKQIINK